MKTQKQKKNTAFKKTVSVAVMGSVCLAAAFSVAAFTNPVTVKDDDNTVTINTMSTGTSDVLSAPEVTVEETEKEFTVKPENDINVSVMSTLISDNVSAVEESSALLIFNDSNNTALGEDTNESSDVEIKIENWVAVKVNLRGKQMDKDVPAGTVADALAYLNIDLSKDDALNVKKADVLKDGMEIVVTRTIIKTVTKTEAIDYKVVNKETDDLYEGETEVSVAGVEGERTIVTKETYVNGQKTKEEVVSNEITKEAVDKVVLVGTAEKVSYVNNSGSVEVDESANIIYDKYGNALTYTSVHTGSSTAYTAPYGALTATGRLARYGVVAVNPNIIPYGSILYIVSDDGMVYGYAVAGDTGGFIYNGTNTVVDLYFPTYDDCCYYGRRNVHVYVLSGVSEDATYNN